MKQLYLTLPKQSGLYLPPLSFKPRRNFRLLKSRETLISRYFALNFDQNFKSHKKGEATPFIISQGKVTKRCPGQR